ncbi:FtsX-like permease family protein [Paraclostridium ghonii]|uniref:ABC transport system permease protein n=1 Tax=Paraclostridium ghonii TaxID=29358 RepID=A0ABU0N3J8_9FIRM|nr:FtsX-like permease family protein [Paeniclostridium ghonii]MDQ0557705.1 putative ABC transport system permease protein [Paeniclostridium ghonii]
MRNPLFKDTFREIKKSKGRFLSVFAIITLGVSFFTGIKVASPVMEITADKYYDQNNLMDLTVISNLGLTDEDIEEISKVDGVSNVYPTYSKEVLTSIGTNQLVLKVHGLPKKSNSDYINQIKITEGRYPQKEGECLIEDSKDVPLGSTIKIYGDNNEDLSKTLNHSEYKVVGKVKNPYYIAKAKGSSSIGSGTLNSFIMVLNNEFKLDNYTESYITVDGAKDLNSYSKEYEDKVQKVENKLVELGEDRAGLRYKKIINDASEKLSEGKLDLQKEKTKAYDELNKAKNDIENSKSKITNNENSLHKKETQVKNDISSLEKSISASYEKLNLREIELNKQINIFNTSKESVQQEIHKSKEKIKLKEEEVNQLKDYINSIEQVLSNEYLDEEKRKELELILEKSQQKLETSESELSEANKEVKTQEQIFNDTQNKLLSAQMDIEKNKELLNDKKSVIENKKKEAEIEFKNAKYKLDQGKEELEKGQDEYLKNKKEVESKLQKAHDELEREEEKINDIKTGKWYVLDRNTNYGFVDYKNSVDSIESISKIFPVFFFSLAALICLTTMTRMVDEQRINIGTMKALGYKTGSIMLKYILYSLLASVLGSILGNLIGLTVFPSVIYNAYASMTYELPSVTLVFSLKLILLSTLIAVSTTTLASVYSCYKELKEVPSILMRPKSPKDGKRILLERINFVWNRLNFTQKITCRNIFRYKKRFFMTVIGIAGCSALLLTGFGIKDSISSIVDNQYGQIIKYNLTLNYSKDITKNSTDNELKYISNDSRVENCLNIKNKSYKALYKSIEKDANIIVPEDPNSINDFINFKNRVSNKKYTLNNSGVLMSEKLAKLLKVKEGDSIILKNEDNKEFNVKVSGIVENYVGHYIYMTPQVYENMFNEEVRFNEVLINTKDSISQEKLGKDMMNLPNINSATFNTSAKSSFSDMITNLNSVVALIIVSAGALAFIVLYNLTNVNISERIREIATIKVLGFYDNEVSSYVFRENIILTIIGTIIGLFLGVFLHRFIMTTAELEFVMFGREIKTISFILSGMLTFVFASLVNLCMYFKLKKIKMVESLKSVD